MAGPRTQRAPRTRSRARLPLAVRSVRASDLDEVVRQRLGLLRDTRYASLAAIRRYVPRFRRWFRRELRAGRLWGVLAESPDGRAVGGGLVWLQPRAPSPRFPQQEGPYLFSVFTDPDQRGRGVATRVVRALVEGARDRGYARIELHATESGRGVYERLGFVATTQMRLTLHPAKRSRRRSGARSSGRRSRGLS